jgi:hypothetical protein
MHNVDPFISKKLITSIKFDWIMPPIAPPYLDANSTPFPDCANSIACATIRGDATISFEKGLFSSA